jgi:molybdopterin converting factor small subunit
MAVVWIPALMRHLTHGQESVNVDGATVGALIDALESRYPGIKTRLCQNGQMRAGLAVIIDTQVARGGLEESVGATSEVHFIPAIAGGAPIDRAETTSRAS